MQTVMNRTALRNYAMQVSAEKRAGKFSRVGESFMERCEARLEAVIRALAPVTESEAPPVPTNNHTNFTTHVAAAKLNEKVEEAAKRIIHSEVMRHPTTGKTLL